jgi:Uma2 family endonuclease
MTALLLHQWTIEDYHRIVATGVLADSNCELIRGTIIDMPPEGPEHADSCETSARYLERLFGEGWQSRQGKPITLSDSEPEPDIAIVREQSYRARHPFPGDIRLVVEYAYSTQVKDTGIKRDVYAEASIADYLVIDLKRSVVIHYSNPVDGTYTGEQTYAAGVIQVGGVEIDVARLLN